MPHVLTLIGTQTSKKNNLRPHEGRGLIFEKKTKSIRRRKGGLHYDEETKALIESYEWQAKAAWRNAQGPRPPLNRFAYYMELWNQAGDPDGIVTTCLDCLVKAGVITDDAAKHCVRWGGEARTDDHGPRVKVILESLETTDGRR